MNCCSECSVGPGLLMLEEVVDVLGLKSVVVVNAIISVDGLTEDIEDKR